MRQSLWRVFTDFREWRIFMALLNKSPGQAGEIPKAGGK
jgi:hypothetical protein